MPDNIDQPPQPPCDLCARQPDKPCKRCAARRHEATKLYEARHPISEIAGQLQLGELRVMRLLEQAADRALMQTTKPDEIPVSAVRRLVDSWRAQDPENHTYLELAARAGYDTTSRIQRLLGVIPTSAVKKGETVYRGRICTTISPANAGRLLRAMGHLPCDIPGA